MALVVLNNKQFYIKQETTTYITSLLYNDDKGEGARHKAKAIMSNKEEKQKLGFKNPSYLSLFKFKLTNEVKKLKQGSGVLGLRIL